MKAFIRGEEPRPDLSVRMGRELRSFLPEAPVFQVRGHRWGSQGLGSAQFHTSPRFSNAVDPDRCCQADQRAPRRSREVKSRFPKVWDDAAGRPSAAECLLRLSDMKEPSLRESGLVAALFGLGRAVGPGPIFPLWFPFQVQLPKGGFPFGFPLRQPRCGTLQKKGPKSTRKAQRKLTAEPSLWFVERKAYGQPTYWLHCIYMPCMRHEWVLKEFLRGKHANPGWALGLLKSGPSPL